jgi:hypothetical protein
MYTLLNNYNDIEDDNENHHLEIIRWTDFLNTFTSQEIRFYFIL